MSGHDQPAASTLRWPIGREGYTEFERGRSDVRYQLLALSSWERAGYRTQWERLARGGKRGRDRAYCLGILWELRAW